MKVAADKNVESIKIRIKPEMSTGKCILTKDLNEERVLLFFKIGMDLLMILTMYMIVSTIPTKATKTDRRTGMNGTKNIMKRPKMIKDNPIMAILI